MNKIFSYCAVLLFSVSAFSLVSCTEEYDYTGAKAEGEQVYFSNSLLSTLEVSSSENSFQIPVNRVNTNGSVTVPLDITMPDNSDYTVTSSSVTFADGESEAYLTFTYDPENMDYDTFQDISIAVADAAYTSQYGDSSYSFSVAMTAWVTMDGYASFRDGIMADMYGADFLVYDVEIQESETTPGRYRIVNPYSAETTFGKTYGYFFSFAEGNHYIVIDATDPDYVWVDGEFYSGAYYVGNGEILFYSQVYAWMQQGYSVDYIKQTNPEVFGKLKDGVITFPAVSLLAEVPDDPNLYGADYSGMFAVALPGYEIKDYSASFEYTGRFTDTSDVDYAQGTITFSSDVASVKYYVAADGDDVDAIIEAINEGDLDAEKITESGTSLSFELTESGYYTVILIMCDENGDMVSSSTTKFYFKSGNSTSTEAVWVPIHTGYYYYNMVADFVSDQYGNYPGSVFEQAIVDDEVLYQNMSNPTEYKVEPWGMADDGCLMFTMDSEGYISFINQDTGLTYEESGTTYTVYGSDFFTLLPEYTDGTATSWRYHDDSYDPNYYEYDFGTIYHINDYYGGYGYFGGAYESFYTDSGINASRVQEIEDNAKVPRSLRKSDLTSNRISVLTNGVYNSKTSLFKKILANKPLSLNKQPAKIKKLK
ncbi:MAG: hypothetical protein LUC88_00685 [Prevotella sp.]|nr:hypothetical protein [Prevotella sp.]